MWDINRVSERLDGSGPKTKSGKMGTDSIAEVGWGEGVQVSSILLWLGGRRIGSASGKESVREEGSYILTSSRWRKEVTGAGVVRKGRVSPSPEEQ